MKMKNSKIINLLKADLRATLRDHRWMGISLFLVLFLSFWSLTNPFEERYLQMAYFYIPLFLTIFTSTFVAKNRKGGFISGSLPLL